MGMTLINAVPFYGVDEIGVGVGEGNGVLDISVHTFTFCPTGASTVFCIMNA